MCRFFGVVVVVVVVVGCGVGVVVVVVVVVVGRVVCFVGVNVGGGGLLKDMRRVGWVPERDAVCVGVELSLIPM